MTDRRHPADSTNAPLERAKSRALGRHDDRPGLADHVGEAAGGITGAVAGVAIGAIAGPLSTLMGGIAGAMSGWWTGRAIAEAASAISRSDERYYREHFARSPARLADRRYEDVRPAYHLGHIASHNPNFLSRTFDEVEPELRRGWSDEASARYGKWAAVRGYVREGYTRGRWSAARSSVRPGRASEDARLRRRTGLAPEGDDGP